jgi:hypothetical protein
MTAYVIFGIIKAWRTRPSWCSRARSDRRRSRRQRGSKQASSFVVCSGERLFRCLTRGPCPSIGARCHELRIQDAHATWRIIYRIDPSEIVVVEVFSKKAQATPKSVIDTCKARLEAWDAP